MTHADAVDFLVHAGPFGGTWADIGAGTGTFTRALAELLGRDGAVIAIDRDARALATLASQRDDGLTRHAHITALPGDMHDLAAIDELAELRFDGILFANVLHFTNRPDAVLADAAARLRPAGRILVIEYDTRWPNPWVPHPLPESRLARTAEKAGLGAPDVVARRPSRYHRAMYLARVPRHSPTAAGEC